MTHERRCKICDRLIPEKRTSNYPCAVSCGKRECAVEYKRAQSNTIRKRYRDRRLASDPAFRLRERQRARERYVKSRLRLGKTPAVREPIEAENTFLATLLQRAARVAAEVVRKIA